MRFDPPLIPARFIRRYKRFLVDAELPDGTVVVAHSTNTGALTGCLREGAACLLQPAPPESTRKLRYTFEMIRVGRRWVGVNTMRANQLALEALRLGNDGLADLPGYPRRVTEWPFVDGERSRVDVVLSRGGELDPDAPKRSRLPYRGDERVYVELKSTTLVRDGVAAFPDAPTERGRKHLRALMDVVERGQRAAMLYVVTRGGVDHFEPADDVDPEYGELLREAAGRGVEVYALSSRIGPREMRLDKKLPIRLRPR